jgi:hypothetical protein
MQLTLQITAGPHAGRKVLLRSGQIARIGRTEWADFSFPRDADLAEIHFAVQCQLQGARVRKLAADKPLSVNAKEVTEVELAAGDTILAGQTLFIVAFDGQAAPAAGAASMATITGASFVATGAAAAAAAKKEAASTEPTAQEIAEHLQLAEEHKAVAAKVKTGPDLVAALAAQGAFAKAVRVQAHLLPKRHAVWWGVHCVSAACADTLSPGDCDAKDAAEAWVKDPGERERRACEAAAAQTKFDGPGSWLAMAAFWSGGSMVPAEMSAVPPDDKLTGQAVTSSLMIAASLGDPTKAKDRYRIFLAKAPDIASGKIPLPGNPQPEK